MYVLPVAIAATCVVFLLLAAPATSGVSSSLSTGAYSKIISKWSKFQLLHHQLSLRYQFLLLDILLLFVPYYSPFKVVISAFNSSTVVDSSFTAFTKYQVRLSGFTAFTPVDCVVTISGKIVSIS